ncbi:hypothetical protein B0H13DRAFT_1897844 [Mycena leptocephala]|nr:hypothetical protein B0H13DRAFT_1897844 [Mycena leptocephala]
MAKLQALPYISFGGTDRRQGTGRARRLRKGFLSVHLINFEDIVDAIIDGRDLEILQFASETWVRYRYQELRVSDLVPNTPAGEFDTPMSHVTQQVPPQVAANFEIEVRHISAYYLFKPNTLRTAYIWYDTWPRQLWCPNPGCEITSNQTQDEDNTSVELRVGCKRNYGIQTEKTEKYLGESAEDGLAWYLGGIVKHYQSRQELRQKRSCNANNADHKVVLVPEDGEDGMEDIY